MRNWSWTRCISMIWAKASPSLGATQPLDRVLKGWEENLHLKNEFTNICYKKSPIFDMWNHQYLISRCTIFMFVFIWYFCKIDIEVGSTVFVVISLQEMTKVFKILRQPCLYSLEQKITKFSSYYYAIKKLVSPERNIGGTQDSVQLCESQTSHYNVLKIW